MRNTAHHALQHARLCTGFAPRNAERRLLCAADSLTLLNPYFVVRTAHVSRCLQQALLVSSEQSRKQQSECSKCTSCPGCRCTRGLETGKRCASEDTPRPHHPL